VGNKKDLNEQRVVEMTDGAKFALENGKAASHSLKVSYRVPIYGMLSLIRRKHRRDIQQVNSNHNLQNRRRRDT
jgi:hypothetical protein